MSRPREAYIADILARVPDDDDAEKNAAYAECEDCQVRDFDECVHYEGPGPMCCGCKQDVVLDDSGGDWVNGVDVCNTCMRDEHDLLVSEVRRLRAERDELAAEVAALLGKPEGALPGWDVYHHGYDGHGYQRNVDALRRLVVRVPRGNSIRRNLSHDGVGVLDEAGAESPRAAMRAAEAAARSRGWL